MTDQHPITPAPKLVEEWANRSASIHRENGTCAQHEFMLATQAARWGADQELEACCEWVSQWRCMVGGNRPELGLRAARRPKPPSLKEQALQALANADGADHPVVVTVLTADEHALIRKALEQLDD